MNPTNNRLILQAFGGLIFLVLVLAAALFISAGTFNFWQAWVFLAVFFSPCWRSRST